MRKYLYPSIILSILFIVSCEDVTNGEDGLNLIVSSETESSGTNCPNGGIKLSFGSDLNGNGVLSVDEVTETTYVCNGLNGNNGLDGIDGIDGSEVDVQIVQWTSSGTQFSQTDSPNGGDGYVYTYWTNPSLTSNVVNNGLVIIQLGSSSTGPWFNIPYILYDGDDSDVNYIYDSWYSYSVGQVQVNWSCSFGRTLSEWLNVSSLYETYYKIITVGF